METEVKCPNCNLTCGSIVSTYPSGKPTIMSKLDGILHKVDGWECAGYQLEDASKILKRFDWWMNHLQYKAPEQMHEEVMIMLQELHPANRKRVER